MKYKILQFVLLILFSLTFTKGAAQLAKVSYSAKIAHVTSNCQLSGGCGEIYGNSPDFTAKIKSKDNISTNWFNSGCLQCNASSSSCTYAQNTLLQQGRENTSDILSGHIEAWEDDVGDRCTYTEYIDLNIFILGYINLENPYYDEAYMSQEYSYNYRQWDFPTSSAVFTPGPLWGYSNLHSFKLSCSWRYIGTDNLITPNCTAQTANYTAGGVKSWSLALTAGKTYKFNNCTSGDNGTRLRLYASDGYTALETNTSSCSELVFTPTTTGTYYLEVFQVVNNVRSEVAQPGVLTYKTDASFAPIAIAQTFCGPTTANNLVPAISLTSKWYASATSTTALTTTSVLSSGTYYAVSVVDGNCESERTPVSITVRPLPSAPISFAQTFCSLSVPTTLDLVATGTNKKWYRYTNEGFEMGTFALTTGTYYVSQTVNGCESAQTPVSVTVNITAAPTASDYQSFCSSLNPTIANLTAAGSNIKWYSAATGGTPLSTTVAISQGNYYASQTINGCESTRTVVYAYTTTKTPPTSYAQSFCSGSNPTVASLVAYGIATKWYLAATGGTALATTTAVSTGTYYVSQFDNGCESTRTAVSVTVSATPSAPTAASAQSVCSVANPTIANLTATGTGIKWYYSEIFGTALATTTAISSGLYYVSQTINGCESTRTTVNVTVATAPSAPIASSQLLCSASNPTVANLVATGIGIKWYSDATGGTALATSAAISTGTYYVSQTTNDCESTRTSVSVTVGSSIAAPTASAQSFCSGSNPTVANLTATGASIKWYLNAAGGTALATTAAISTRTYYVSQSASGCESTRTPVGVTVNTTLSAPTAYAQSFCTGTNPKVASLVTITGLVVKWYLVATGGTALAASTSISTGTYYVSESSSGCESTRTPVSVTVNPSPSTPTAVAQSFCLGWNAKVVYVEVTGTGFTRIYSTPTGGTQLSSLAILSTGTYYAAKFANGCESARIPVSVTVSAIPSAPTASAQSFCSVSNPTTANLTPSGTGIEWYPYLQQNGPPNPTTPLSTGTYLVYQTINGCRSDATEVNVTVKTSPSYPAAASTVYYTVGDIPTALTATTKGDGLLWYTTATGGSSTTTAPTPSTATIGSTSYWVSSTDSTIGCEGDRVEIVVNVHNKITNAPTTNLPTQVYAGNDKNLTTLQVTGSTIKWYNAGTGGTLLPSTTLLVDETTYYASQTIAGVESTARLAITVNKISENTQTLQANSTVANLVTTPSTGSNSQWFTVASGGTALAGTTLLTNGNYYVQQASTTGIATLGTGFDKSWGVAIQTDGKIVFSDYQNNAIKRMNADGTGIVTLATGFNGPRGIAIQTDGKIVVADFNNHSIKRINADGTGIVTLATLATVTTLESGIISATAYPRYVAIQADGKILFTDDGNNVLCRMNPDGSSIVTLVKLSSDNIRGFAIQPDGKIVVAIGTTIRRMDSDGSNMVTLATGLGYPNKVAIQADGKIIIAEGQNSAIKRMNADGSNIVTLATVLNNPTDVAVQADGKILVADYPNAAIKRISAGTTSNRVAATVQLDVPSITSTQTNVLCNGSATGAINISTTGGTAPYTYNWGAGITTKDRTGLTAGTYSVTVTDANGITDTETITITQPDVLTSIITSQTNVTCYGSFNGSATISAAGGTPGYTYSWAPSGGTSATITGRAAGDYTCTITDANGCTKTQLVTITQSNALSSSIISQTDVSCNGGSDGSATISASGGASGYTYSWAPSGGTSSTITGRTAGEYTCTITDALGCIKTQTVTIQSAFLNNTVAQFCGVLIASLKGATYQWYACPNTIIPGATNQMYTPTTVGDYKVVTSLGDCTVTSTCITVAAPTAASPQIICNSGTVANLTATATATGIGTLSWYAAATGGIALPATTNLASGTYYVSQTLNSCESESVRTAVVVSVNPLPAAPAASAQAFCNAATVANLVATGTGTMNWYAAATDGTALTTTASLATGTYYVSQTNADGCESYRTSFEVIINTLPTAPTITTPVNYILGATATALTATSAGTVLMWYPTATGGTGSATAPTPNTATAGTTSYWVSSTSDAGCESTRAEMVVIVTLPATHLNFDGVNDYITLTNEAAFDFTNQMTVEFWMNSNTTPTQWDALVAKGDNSWRVALTAAGKINFAGNSGFGDVTSNAVVTDGTWHHVAVTYNGTNAIIYIDGVQNASVSGTGTIANSAFNVSIGENLQTLGRNYTGNMDEVRIWNIARTSFQISSARNCELQGNESGLLAYYKFNQGIAAASNTTITSLTNAVSGGANGALQNFALTGTTSNWLAGSPIVTGIMIPSAPTATAQTFTTAKTVADLVPAPSTVIKWYTVATGGTALTNATILTTGTYFVSQTNANGCESERTAIAVTMNIPATHLNFNGQNNDITLPASIGNVLSGGTELTIEYWFKGTDLQSGVRIQNGNNYIVAGWGLGANPSFIVSTDGGTTGVTCGPATTIENNSWHHLAFVWKKNGVFATYLNGVLQNSRTAANVNLPIFSGTSMRIGSLNGTSEFINGSMDDVRIWNIARSAAQIASARNCELQGNETNLVAYYKFNQGIAAASNTTILSLINAVSAGANGTLQNFALTGTTSNWLSGSPIVTGIMIPSAPTANAQSFCGSKTVAALVPAPSTTIKWYTVATGGTALVSTTAVATGTYYVSETNANGCESARTSVAVTTGTMPTGITATLSASSGVSGSTFTAAATGVTSWNGLTVQWQKFVNNSWTDIAGATSLSSLLTAETGAAGTSTNYRLKLTCTETNVSVYSTTVSLTLVYCAAGANETTFEKIENFTLGTINNNSTSTAGYENFTSISTTLIQGSQYTLSLKNSYPDQDQAIIWIDFNQNGNFDDVGEQVYESGINANQFITGMITIPNSALLGSTRMRVRLHYTLQNPNTTPCGNSSFGQVEDYTVIIACPAGIWTGTTSTDWHTASNWCDNSVPTATSNVVIANTVNKPLITANTEILNLSIQADAKLNVANTLTVTQNIVNEGQLIFKSNATSTGQFGVFNGTISGNGTAVVERYIPAKRAWRALTSPLKGTNGSIYAQWQNNGVVIPNVGAEIWGPSGTGLATGQGYSVLDYTSTGYVDVTNTQTKNLFDTNKNNAYLMFVTGGYGSGNIANEVAQPTTLSATGKLITGNVINSNINDVRHNLIGNPYASALNPATLLDNSTNLIQKFWVWDPHSGTSGGYVMYDKAAGTYNNTTGSYPTGTTAVQSGQGFFVKATTGNTGSITLTENNKSSAVTNAVFSTNTPEIFRLGMYRQQAQNWLPLDGAIAVMYPSANPEVDANDGRKFVNSSENIAFRRSNTSLSSEHHLPLVANDVLYIKVWNTTPNMYKLRLNTESFDATNLDAKLQDLYTNVDTVLNLEGSINEYLFNVTSDVASTNDRFRIVFQAKGALSTNESNKNPFIIAPNPVTNQIVTVYFKDNQPQKLKYTLINTLGQLVSQGNINSDNTINVATVASGVYVLQLQTENNEVYTSKLIIK